MAANHCTRNTSSWKSNQGWSLTVVKAGRGREDKLPQLDFNELRVLYWIRSLSVHVHRQCRCAASIVQAFPA